MPGLNFHYLKTGTTRLHQTGGTPHQQCSWSVDPYTDANKYIISIAKHAIDRQSI